ncbi:TetR/AcrR family transcriptional regulator [Pelosinus baikalensis]|uniref:TetR/AcrR family transcriptional regulator n=1 Tax=Pelosinus baikalensis TaxID=2892015 RepID=A0ABS8I168_9FIRM|nr:TetR/AcrR family transcriptional regulator [Pelosinus baikalensis]MCC5468659.1 TetR/AcrR family transcriptional regulator [Pelosinus baikalensis]
MKKNISKEQIVDTALELMRNKNDIRGLNLREIARTLGCAHTNLYNYFPSYTDLLWETHTALQEIFMEMLKERIMNAKTADLKLRYFFDTFVDIYLTNKGWFRLAWLEYIGENRPERDAVVTEHTFTELTQYISDIWQELHGNPPDKDQTGRVLHNTHCYIVGEISNYVSGRGLIENEAELKGYIVDQAVNILTLCLQKG